MPVRGMQLSGLPFARLAWQTLSTTCRSASCNTSCSGYICTGCACLTRQLLLDTYALDVHALPTLADVYVAAKAPNAGCTSMHCHAPGVTVIAAAAVMSLAHIDFPLLGRVGRGAG